MQNVAAVEGIASTLENHQNIVFITHKTNRANLAKALEHLGEQNIFVGDTQIFYIEDNV